MHHAFVQLLVNGLKSAEDAHALATRMWRACAMPHGAQVMHASGQRPWRQQHFHSAAWVKDLLQLPEPPLSGWAVKHVADDVAAVHDPPPGSRLRLATFVYFSRENV